MAVLPINRLCSPWMNSSRSRDTPRGFSEGVVYETTGACEAGQTSEFCRVNLYYPAIDAFSQSWSATLLTWIKTSWEHQACNSTSSNFLDPKLPWATDQYVLHMVWTLIYSSWSCQLPSALCCKRTSKCQRCCVRTCTLNTCFPTLLYILQLAMTISISSPTCEVSLI